MLLRFAVKNYRTFEKELVLDFRNTRDYKFNSDCVSNGCTTKLMIYGRNGVGKTNLGRAIQDIYYTNFDGRIHGFIDDMSYLNANSKDQEAGFSYTFDFNGKIVNYSYRKKSLFDISSEELHVCGRCIYYYDHVKGMFLENNLSDFDLGTLDLSKYENVLLNREIDENRPSLLSWIYTNSKLDNNSVFGQIIQFSLSMRLKSIKTSNIMIRQFLAKLQQKEELERLESFFNLMGIKCKFEVIVSPDGQPELFYCYADRLVSFESAASSGAKDLLSLYIRIIFQKLNIKPSIVFIDEFDAYFHYEMAEKLVLFLKHYFKDSQVILTSHNTNLISNQILRPDCYLILSQDGRLTALCDATTRELREGHNLEKMYISGEFDSYE